ncbi:MAG: hypothetical protein K6E35_06920 [Bacteroidales bacterium]|nr:hypothetical protein [Bacteroidales bacterium]
MKKIIKLFSVAALYLASLATASAQDTVETSLGTDIVSQYVWRGQELGGVSVQPSLGVSYKGLSLSAWGSVGLANAADTREFDLTLAYEIGGFNIGVTDYWFNAGLDPLNRYFAYASNCTNHVFEATVGYDFGFASLQWYTNFAGNDGVTPAGKRAFSSYLEANVPFVLGGVDWTATAGVVPFATDFYGVDRFALVNLALTAAKDIRITDTFSIPVFAQMAFNPYSRGAYLVLGITLQP